MSSTTSRGHVPDRRPLRTRRRPLAHAAAGRLAALGVSPNTVSVAGVAFAAGAGACLALLPHVPSGGPRAALLVAAALLVQLRLAANLLDGLVAVEAGRGTRTGPLFNEVPDRLADLLVLVPAGYAVTGVAWGPELGWAAGTLAVLTAYIRLLGGSLGQPQRFGGPLAKPHRMFVLTVACLGSLAETGAGAWRGTALAVGLAVVAAGSALTCALRLRAVAADLPAAPTGGRA